MRELQRAPGRFSGVFRGVNNHGVKCHRMTKSLTAMRLYSESGCPKLFSSLKRRDETSVCH